MVTYSTHENSQDNFRFTNIFTRWAMPTIKEQISFESSVYWCKAYSFFTNLCFAYG
jgi:hypothetical protein